MSRLSLREAVYRQKPVASVTLGEGPKVAAACSNRTSRPLFCPYPGSGPLLVSHQVFFPSYGLMDKMHERWKV